MRCIALNRFPTFLSSWETDRSPMRSDPTPQNYALTPKGQFLAAPEKFGRSRSLSAPFIFFCSTCYVTYVSWKSLSHFHPNQRPRTARLETVETSGHPLPYPMLFATVGSCCGLRLPIVKVKVPLSLLELEEERKVETGRQ